MDRPDRTGAVEIAQRLIQFDTSNPPGNEGDCIAYLADLMRAEGLETELSAKAPERPNLLARLPGRGEAPPFLMYGHVDVVPVEGQDWAQPPFAGRIVDGELWGRGAIDMKGGLAMMAAALIEFARQGNAPAGDVLFLALSDEECGSEFGALHVVEEHPEWLDGVRYAIGELGGFSVTLAGRRVYPISVTEKQWCEVSIRIHGPGGHGSVPVRGGAMAKLGEVLERLDRKRLPVHVTPVSRQMIRGVADSLPVPRRQALRGLLRPRLTDRLLDAAGSEAAAFDPMLHNTVSPAKVQAAMRTDAIPDTVELELDGRVLPGSSSEQLLAELQELVGEDGDVNLTRTHDTVPAEPDLGLFGELAAVIQAVDPDGVCIPMVFPAVTDGRFLARHGIQSYGFLPMRLPEGFDPASLAHAPNERVPVEALEFGATVIGNLLRNLDRQPAA